MHQCKLTKERRAVISVVLGCFALAVCAADPASRIEATVQLFHSEDLSVSQKEGWAHQVQ